MKTVIKYIFLSVFILFINACSTKGVAIPLSEKSVNIKNNFNNIDKISLKVKANNYNEMKHQLAIYLQYSLKHSMWIYSDSLNDTYYSRNTWFEITDNNIILSLQTSGYIKRKNRTTNLMLGGYRGFYKYKISLPLTYKKRDNYFILKITNDSKVNILESINKETKKVFKYSVIKDTPLEFYERIQKALNILFTMSKRIK